MDDRITPHPSATPKAKRALTILRDYNDRYNHDITGGRFAPKMWPERWDQGTARTRSGLRRAGGSYLSWLQSKGWVGISSWDFDGHTPRYCITPTGREALQ